MRVVGYRSPLKYGVLLYNIVGSPVQDRQRCANTIKEAHKIALVDMKSEPLSCATIYRIYKGEAVPVRYVDAAGKLIKPKLA